MGPEYLITGDDRTGFRRGPIAHSRAAAGLFKCYQPELTPRVVRYPCSLPAFASE